MTCPSPNAYVKYSYKYFYLIGLRSPSGIPKRRFWGRLTGVYRSYRCQDQGDSNRYFQRACASYFSLAVRLRTHPCIANRMSCSFGDSEDPLCGSAEKRRNSARVAGLDHVHSGWTWHVRYSRLPYEKKRIPRRPEKFAGTTTRWGTFGGLERQNRGKNAPKCRFGSANDQNQEPEIRRPETLSNLGQFLHKCGTPMKALRAIWSANVKNLYRVKHDYAICNYTVGHCFLDARDSVLNDASAGIASTVSTPPKP